MVAREELVRIASRYDTSMSRAMLRALGAVAPGCGRAAGRRFSHLMWCFRNHGSPMDGGR